MISHSLYLRLTILFSSLYPITHMDMISHIFLMCLRLSLLILLAEVALPHAVQVIYLLEMLSLFPIYLR